MDYTDYSFATPLITAGEQILWKGTPGKAHLFLPSDLFMIPFSIFWCGFAFFWEFGVISSGAPFFFALFGLPFIGVGLYITVGRFIWKVYIRKRTAYVITNRKIIRKQGSRIDTLEKSAIMTTDIRLYDGGYGTITLNSTTYYSYRRHSYNRSTPFILDNIPNVTAAQQALASME